MVGHNDEEEFMKMIKNGWSMFFYYKTNGEQRYAVGTICEEELDKIGANHIQPERNPNNLRYYDLTKKEPRTMKLDNLVGFYKMENYMNALFNALEIKKQNGEPEPVEMVNEYNLLVEEYNKKIDEQKENNNESK